MRQPKLKQGVHPKQCSLVNSIALTFKWKTNKPKQGVQLRANQRQSTQKHVRIKRIAVIHFKA
eukprot:1161966-Pelagomonas_calceolata.AAC.11